MTKKKVFRRMKKNKSKRVLCPKCGHSFIATSIKRDELKWQKE